MGAAKHAWIEHQENVAQATGVLIRYGTLKQCEFHDDCIWEGDGDIESAYRRANAEQTRGTLNFGGLSRREVTDALKQACEDWSCADECARCRKLMDE